MGATIQFKGKAAVLDAYNSRGVAAFCICQGANMNFKYQADQDGESLEVGADLLEGYLDNLKDSVAVYTLKVFEDPAEKIRSNTPNDGAFNFRLSMPESEQGGRVGNNEILSELNAIRKRLDDQEQEEEQEEEPGNQEQLKGILNGVFGNPALMPIISNLAAAWATKLFPGDKPAPDPAALLNPAALSGVEDPNINDAIATLKMMDPLLGAHLLKLAKIASEKPETYAMLLQLLNK
jgi:hypothetical protein